MTEGKENLLNPNPSKKQKKVTNSVTSTGISRPIVLLTSGLDDEDSQQLIAKFVDAFPHASVAMAIEATSTSSGPASTANIYVDKSYDAASAEANASVETAVTHLVVPVDRHNVFPHRTIKYLQAMIGKNSLHTYHQ